MMNLYQLPSIPVIWLEFCYWLPQILSNDFSQHVPSFVTCVGPDAAPLRLMNMISRGKGYCAFTEILAPSGCCLISPSCLAIHRKALVKKYANIFPHHFFHHLAVPSSFDTFCSDCQNSVRSMLPSSPKCCSSASNGKSFIHMWGRSAHKYDIFGYKSCPRMALSLHKDQYDVINAS